MNELLTELLDTLAAIAHEDADLEASRSQLTKVILNGFLKPVEGYVVPEDYGLSSPSLNQRVRHALEQYITGAKRKAEELGLDYQGRLAAFQNPDITTKSHVAYDDFFSFVSGMTLNDSGDWVVDA